MDTITNLINIVKNDKRNNFDLHDNIKHIIYYLKEYSKQETNSTINLAELTQLFNILEEQSDKSSGPFYS
ncbi:MAG: hypothetical protein PWR27_344 [Petroclostridium sp.]|jgi:hypothetical protein|nr:hypothetical protein [Petroclostridium sp.]